MKTGIDIGNGWTKFDGMRFASRVKVGKLPNFGVRAAEKHQIHYKDTDYIIGEGNIFVGDDRYTSLEYKLCVLTAIALLEKRATVKHIDAKICVGVPLGSHRRVAEIVKTTLLNMVNETIVVNDRVFNITISDVTVFVEGAYPLLLNDSTKGNTITIDMGAGTINVTEWDGQTPVKQKTYSDALYKMQDDIITLLSEDYGLTDITLENIDDYLGKESIEIGSRVIDISEHIKIMDSAIQGVASKIKLAFGVTTARKIYLMGGGGIATENAWDKCLDVELVEDSQYINSKIYNGIAVQTYAN